MKNADTEGDYVFGSPCSPFFPSPLKGSLQPKTLKLWRKRARSGSNGSFKVIYIRMPFSPHPAFFLCLPAFPPSLSSTSLLQRKGSYNRGQGSSFVSKRRRTASGSPLVKEWYRWPLPAILLSQLPWLLSLHISGPACIFFPSISPMCKELLRTRKGPLESIDSGDNKKMICFVPRFLLHSLRIPSKTIPPGIKEVAESLLSLQKEWLVQC